MGDAASPPPKRSIAERKLRMQVSLQRLQTSFEQAVSIVTEEHSVLADDHEKIQEEHCMLEAAQASLQEEHRVLREAQERLREEHNMLRGAHESLQGEHAALQQTHHDLQNEFDAAKQQWREFRQWWKVKMAIKATQQTPSRSVASSPNMETPGITSTALNGLRKSKLTRTDAGMLKTLDLDSSCFGTPESERKEPGTTIKVKKEVLDDEKVPHPSPLARAQSGSHSALVPGHRSDKKRPRSPAIKDDYNTPSRRAFEDIGNRSVSDAPSEEQESPVKSSSHRTLESDSVKKRSRGRQSAGQSSDTSRTINEVYEVDPERNGNVSFLHKSVVRDKAERKQMHAHDCDCCSNYYKAVGEAPLRRYQDPKKYADQLKAVAGGEDDESDAEGERKRQLHRQQISRHRDYGTRPANTPPAYWDTGFPSTQKMEEINRLAREEHAKKWDQVARDPRFKKRV